MYRKLLNFKVTFNLMGGTPEIDPLNVLEDSTITAPTNPTKEHFKFFHWQQQGKTTAFNFDSPITDNITLEAKWKYLEFFMVVEDIFTISEKKVVVGKVLNGSISKNDTIFITNPHNGQKIYGVTVLKIEIFKNEVPTATEGMNVGLYLNIGTNTPILGWILEEPAHSDTLTSAQVEWNFFSESPRQDPISLGYTSDIFLYNLNLKIKLVSFDDGSDQIKKGEKKLCRIDTVTSGNIFIMPIIYLQYGASVIEDGNIVSTVKFTKELP